MSRHPSEKKLSAALAKATPDDHLGAERAWPSIRSAYAEREQRSRAPAWIRWLVAVASATAIAAFALSPAGARVGELIERAVGVGEQPARPALRSLPTEGSLLVESRLGPWVVSEDGSKRLLGAYRDATWSPHGLYVAATTPNELVALEPDGDLRWSLAQDERVRDPRWSTSGFRIAYRSGTGVRVVGGDGVGDHLIDASARSVAPAWRPPPKGALERDPTGTRTHQLSYVDADGRVVLVDADSRARIWRARVDGSPITELAWSEDGERLLIVRRQGWTVLDRDGRLVVSTGGAPVDAASISPSGRRIAVSYQQRRAATVQIQEARPRAQPVREIFSGPGRIADLVWSPDARWLLIGWRSGDQWVFVRRFDRKVSPVGSISRQFAPGKPSSRAYPQVTGWCCHANRR